MNMIAAHAGNLPSEIDGIWHALRRTGARSVAFVSATAGEGTTTMAEALAHRAARAGSKVLLAEANPSRPALAARFGVITAPDAVHHVGATGLGVIARPAAVEDAGLLRDRLSMWQADWDLVVLDAVPLLESGMGGLVAAAAADATVLVVRAGHVAAMQLRAARERLGRVEANLLGVVMNDRDDPSLLTELERETHRLGRFMPGLAKALRKRLARAPLLALRV